MQRIALDIPNHDLLVRWIVEVDGLENRPLKVLDTSWKTVQMYLSPKSMVSGVNRSMSGDPSIDDDEETATNSKHTTARLECFGSTWSALRVVFGAL